MDLAKLDNGAHSFVSIASKWLASGTNDDNDGGGGGDISE